MMILLASLLLSFSPSYLHNQSSDVHKFSPSKGRGRPAADTREKKLTDMTYDAPSVCVSRMRRAPLLVRHRPDLGQSPSVCLYATFSLAAPIASRMTMGRSRSATIRGECGMLGSGYAMSKMGSRWGGVKDGGNDVPLRGSFESFVCLIAVAVSYAAVYVASCRL
jgi:hypothetical protein